MIAHPRLLIEVCSDLADFRQSRGNRHPVSALLTLAGCALLCGDRRYRAIAAWGRNDGTESADALGFTHHTPWASTLPTILRCIDREAFAAKGGAWVEGGVATTPVAPDAPAIARAVDGQTLRGAKKQGAPEPHRLSVVAHRAGLTLPPQAVTATTKESKAVEPVFDQVVRTGRIVTMEARRTQRQVAQTMGEAGGEAVMLVKDNPPQRKADIAWVCPLPPAGDRQERGRPVALGHERIETRHRTTREALVGYSDGPGLAQGFDGGRHGITQNTAKERVDVVDGVTSLCPERATPHRLWELVRGQWGMEHKSHGVRDVPCEADRSQVRCGHRPPRRAA